MPPYLTKVPLNYFIIWLLINQMIFYFIYPEIVSQIYNKLHSNGNLFS